MPACAQEVLPKVSPDDGSALPARRGDRGHHVQLDALRAQRSTFADLSAAAEPRGVVLVDHAERRCRVELVPAGRSPRWVIVAPTNSAAEPLGYAATHAPQLIQVTASNAVLARVWAPAQPVRRAAPVETVMYPSAAMIRSSPLRSTTRSLTTGNGAARLISPSMANPRARSCLRGNRCRARSGAGLRGCYPVWGVCFLGRLDTFRSLFLEDIIPLYR